MPAKVKGFAYGSIVTTFLGFMLVGVSGWVTLQASQVPSLQKSFKRYQQATDAYRDRVESKIDAVLALQSEQDVSGAEMRVRLKRCEEDIKRCERLYDRK